MAKYLPLGWSNCAHVSYAKQGWVCPEETPSCWHAGISARASPPIWMDTVRISGVREGGLQPIN